jgi:hypothetical protein
MFLQVESQYPCMSFGQDRHESQYVSEQSFICLEWDSDSMNAVLLLDGDCIRLKASGVTYGNAVFLTVVLCCSYDFLAVHPKGFFQGQSQSFQQLLSA